MTPHDLPAGRELDALIAEKVFGVEPLEYLTTTLLGERMFVNLPAYSTDIAAAWLIAEEMKSKLFSRRHAFVQALQEQMLVNDDKDMFVSPSWWIFYLTPEKICLAALKAVGHE